MLPYAHKNVVITANLICFIINVIQQCVNWSLCSRSRSSGGGLHQKMVKIYNFSKYACVLFVGGTSSQSIGREWWERWLRIMPESLKHSIDSLRLLFVVSNMLPLPPRRGAASLLFARRLLSSSSVVAVTTDTTAVLLDLFTNSFTRTC